MHYPANVLLQITNHMDTFCFCCCISFCLFRTYDTADKEEVIVQEIKNWASCNLTSLSLPTLMNDFNTIYTKHLKSVPKCLKSSKTSTLNDTIVTKCIESPIKVCKSAPAVVYKFIRLRMHVVVKLLPYFPNLKIIHLVRDPRGMFDSRNAVGFFANNKNKTADQIEVDNFCQDLESDLAVSKLIKHYNPKQLKFLRYEDLAESPVETVKKLFYFTRLPFTKEVQNTLRKKTSSKKDTCSYCTERRNSTATASKWRQRISTEHAYFIYKTCKKSMNVLGYLPLDGINDIRNISIPSRTKNDVSESLASSLMF